MFKKMIENEIWRQDETSVSRCTSETPTLASTTLRCAPNCLRIFLQRLALQWNMMEHAYPAGDLFSQNLTNMQSKESYSVLM